MIVASEAVERAALADLHAAATQALIDALRLRTIEIGAGLVSIGGALPESAIVVNRAIGLGLGAAEAEATMEAVFEAYRGAGVARYFVQRHPEARPSEIADWCRAAGLEKARGWQKFSRGPGPVPDTPTDLRIAEVGPDHGAAFGRIVCDAFDLGEAAIPWLARLPGRPGWRIFMSFDGDTPAGTGGLFMRDGVALDRLGRHRARLSPAGRAGGDSWRARPMRNRCRLRRHPHMHGRGRAGRSPALL